MRPNPRTAVVLTAIGVEYLAARAFLTGIETLVHPAGTVYETGRFAADGAVWNVVLAETGTGNNIAAIETSRALDAFRPAVALFVGVAGGVKDVAIGDVVAADYVYGYESSKVTETFQPRIKTFGCGYPLVQRARAIRRSDEWHKRLKPGDSPRAFVGPIASGEQVIAGGKTQTHALLEAYCGDTLAVEMEGWGFLFAAHTNGDVPAIVIRGMSDLTADKAPEYDRARQPVAAEHAAAFAFELLATFEPTADQRIKPARPWRPSAG
ncbi:phosphorylase [Actinoplanes sp. CA-131856]